MTVDLAYAELQNIPREKVLLVVGTGASMALDRRFGMEALSDELLKKVGKLVKINGEAENQWKKVEAKLKNGIDLENALKHTNDEFLKKMIVQIAGNFVAKLDKESKNKILEEDKDLPLGLFLQKLVDRLPEYNSVLDIVTPNYDLLIEHTCDKLKIPYITGFWGGITKHENWEEAERQMAYNTYIPRGRKKIKVERKKKHIRLYKVHGSLNWFNKGEEKFEDNSLAYDELKDSSPIERLIITPGDSKYQKAFRETFDPIAKANDAVKGGGAFIFIGYGFNDDHIQKKIKEEITANKKTGIIITKELTANAEILLEQSDNLWAVYHDSKKHGKENENNTLIYNKTYKSPLKINRALWKIDHFTREVLGE